MYHLSAKKKEAIICIKITEIKMSKDFSDADKLKLINQYKRQLTNPNLKSVF
jgi:hypothetical protein